MNQTEIYKPRPARGLRYDDPPALTAQDKRDAQEAAFRLIRRQVGADPDPGRAERMRPRRTDRGAILWRWFGHLGGVASAAWCRKYLGTWAAGGILIWRASIFFSLYERV